MSDRTLNNLRRTAIITTTLPTDEWRYHTVIMPVIRQLEFPETRSTAPTGNICFTNRPAGFYVGLWFQLRFSFTFGANWHRVESSMGIFRSVDTKSLRSLQDSSSAFSKLSKNNKLSKFIRFLSEVVLMIDWLIDSTTHNVTLIAIYQTCRLVMSIILLTWPWYWR